MTNSNRERAASRGDKLAEPITLTLTEEDLISVRDIGDAPPPPQDGGSRSHVLILTEGDFMPSNDSSVDDPVDEAGLESFPASDPPPWTSGTARSKV